MIVCDARASAIASPSLRSPASASRSATRADGWHAYADVAAGAATFTPDGPTAATDPLLLYFTSGTTQLPKLVEHTHASYPAGHLSTMYWLGLQPGDVHLNISSPGWAKHAWSCVFAPWNAEAAVFSSTSRGSTRRRCSTRSWRTASRRCARRRRSGAC